MRISNATLRCNTMPVCNKNNDKRELIYRDSIISYILGLTQKNKRGPKIPRMILLCGVFSVSFREMRKPQFDAAKTGSYFFGPGFGIKSNGGLWLSFMMCAPISLIYNTVTEPVSHARRWK